MAALNYLLVLVLVLASASAAAPLADLSAELADPSVEEAARLRRAPICIQVVSKDPYAAPYIVCQPPAPAPYYNYPYAYPPPPPPLPYLPPSSPASYALQALSAAGVPHYRESIAGMQPPAPVPPTGPATSKPQPSTPAKPASQTSTLAPPPQQQTPKTIPPVQPGAAAATGRSAYPYAPAYAPPKPPAVYAAPPKPAAAYGPPPAAAYGAPPAALYPDQPALPVTMSCHLQKNQPYGANYGAAPVALLQLFLKPSHHHHHSYPPAAAGYRDAANLDLPTDDANKKKEDDFQGEGRKSTGHKEDGPLRIDLLPTQSPTTEQSGMRVSQQVAGKEQPFSNAESQLIPGITATATDKPPSTTPASAKPKSAEEDVKQGAETVKQKFNATAEAAKEKLQQAAGAVKGKLEQVKELLKPKESESGNCKMREAEGVEEGGMAARVSPTTTQRPPMPTAPPLPPVPHQSPKMAFDMGFQQPLMMMMQPQQMGWAPAFARVNEIGGFDSFYQNPYYAQMPELQLAVP